MIVRLLREEAPTLFGFVVFVAVSLLGARLSPENLGSAGSTAMLAGLFAVMLWAAFAVVRHAESLASLLGEPYGTLILTLSVIGIEVALISAVMLTGAANPTLARDTMFAVVMIVLNGLVGLSLVIGGVRHRTQAYNLQGANAFLAVLFPLAVFGLILPRFTESAPGGELSDLLAVFLVVSSVVLYVIFLAIQTITHSDIFRQPVAAGTDAGSSAESHHGLALRTFPYHTVALLAAILPIVLLAKQLAVYIDHGIALAGAPVALGGLLIAAIILTPEGLSAVHAARDNQLQRAVNLCLGSALATIGMTIPAVLAIGWVIDQPVELGLEMVEIVMLTLTLIVSVVTFVSERTNVLQGVVHLALFVAYIVLVFDAP